MKRKKKRANIVFSWILMLIMAFSSCMAGITAYADNTDIYTDDSLCEHHPEHNADCGYLPGGGY